MCQSPFARLSVAIAGVLAVGALATGCGDDNNSHVGHTTSSTKVSTVRIDAAPDGTLRFDLPRVATGAGPVRIEMANPSPVPHAVAVRGSGIDVAGNTVGRDGTSRVETTLAPGTYTLYCPVDAHESAGMTATLTAR